VLVANTFDTSHWIQINLLAIAANLRLPMLYQQSDQARNAQKIISEFALACEKKLLSEAVQSLMDLNKRMQKMKRYACRDINNDYTHGADIALGLLGAISVPGGSDQTSPRGKQMSSGFARETMDGSDHAHEELMKKSCNGNIGFFVLNAELR